MTRKQQIQALLRQGYNQNAVTKLLRCSGKYVQEAHEELKLGLVTVEPYRCPSCGLMVTYQPCLVCRATRYGELQCSESC